MLAKPTGLKGSPSCLAAAGLAMGGTAGLADAAIIYFDVNPNQTVSHLSPDLVSFGEINLGTGTYNLNDTDGTSFQVYYPRAGDLYNGVGNASIQWGQSGSNVLKLSAGTPIDGSTASSWSTSYSYLVNNGAGQWAGGADAYAPLRIDAGGGNFNYGWVNIVFNPGSDQATVTGFAFESTANAAINAAAVPEPATTTILGLGSVFGAAAIATRRRRDGEPRLPDSLLTLAEGGRGVETLRAERSSEPRRDA